ncbi:hypothetical protein NPIL_88221 [Nephila pilipes]|uniref:Uncharacterized protein n=1 Tax=Nephila pilipes TaxID=299642 RepID=A0A8X6U1J2_NEPPI|nr:hypothetical protein NPIL_343171 [Nephila pilipes]GFT92342.1 hypothetical protein NPIL_634171 [Nephila pilipes]GFU40021.1 hypothetical protein NPIL_88221 [Nephila pilipes]
MSADGRKKIVKIQMGVTRTKAMGDPINNIVQYILNETSFLEEVRVFLRLCFGSARWDLRYLAEYKEETAFRITDNAAHPLIWISISKNSTLLCYL